MIINEKKTHGQAMKRIAAAAMAAAIPFTSLLAHAGRSYSSNYQANYIGEAQAKSIAFSHAGVAESQATNLRVRLDAGKRSSDYEVDFYVDNVEYEYEIDAVSGAIKEYDREVKRPRNQGYGGGQAANQPAPAATPNPANYIGEAQAKSIALSAAGLAESQTVNMRVRLDQGRNSSKYEVKFSVGDTRYDIDIDAVTGQIKEFDQETKRNPGSYAPQPAPDPANYIGEAQAKTIAFSHAGIAESQAINLRVHLDQGRNKADYEIKFNAGDYKYEYEIAADSGTVLEYDKSYVRPSNAAVNPPVGAPTQPADPSTYIGEASAKSVALNAAGLAESQVQRMKVKLDRERNTMVYEVEFRNGRYEYEYDVDAVTGAIVKYDVEYDD